VISPDSGKNLKKRTSADPACRDTPPGCPLAADARTPPMVSTTLPTFSVGEAFLSRNPSNFIRKTDPPAGVD